MRASFRPGDGGLVHCHRNGRRAPPWRDFRRLRPYSPGTARDAMLAVKPESEADMPYVVTGTNMVGVISLRRDTPAAALKKARELIGDGVMNVRIADEQGRQYEAAEFDRQHVAEKSG